MRILIRNTGLCDPQKTLSLTPPPPLLLFFAVCLVTMTSCFLEGSVTVMEEADFTEYGRENFGLTTHMLKVIYKILPK